MSAADRRLALLEAAFRVIAAEGVHGATTRAIVAEADMSLASFHYAFTSRDEMMHELIAHVIENQAVAAFESLRFGADLRTALRDGLQAFFEVVTADPAHEQTMFELVQYSLRTPELADLPRRQYAGYRLAVGGLPPPTPAWCGCCRSTMWRGWWSRSPTESRSPGSPTGTRRPPAA
jgi:AcrR family transcriptional regulator